MSRKNRKPQPGGRPPEPQPLAPRALAPTPKVTEQAAFQPTCAWDARRQLQIEALRAAIPLYKAGEDAKGLTLRIRTLGLGQSLGMYARKDRTGLGVQLGRWLARQHPDLAQGSGDLRSIAAAFAELKHGRLAMRLEHQAIAFASALDAMVGIVAAPIEPDLPTFGKEWQIEAFGWWRQEPIELAALRIALALELDRDSLRRASEGDQVLTERVRRALGEVPTEDQLVGAAQALGTFLGDRSSAEVHQSLQALPNELRHSGLVGTLGILHNRERKRRNPHRAGVANILYARLRAHPEQDSERSLRPVDFVRFALGLGADNQERPGAEATSRLLEAEALRWAQAVKHCVTTLQAAEEG